MMREDYLIHKEIVIELLPRRTFKASISCKQVSATQKNCSI
jgi:hypothetical protein